jgi:hypothetical protein
MPTAEVLARTTADGLKTQLFLIIRMQQEATTRADAITAEALARTTADGSKHSYFNNNGCNNSRS